MAGILDLETLNGWGAGYPEKKARREKKFHGIVGFVGSKVADSAG